LVKNRNFGQKKFGGKSTIWKKIEIVESQVESQRNQENAEKNWPRLFYIKKCSEIWFSEEYIYWITLKKNSTKNKTLKGSQFSV